MSSLSGMRRSGVRPAETISQLTFILCPVLLGNKQNLIWSGMTKIGLTMEAVVTEKPEPKSGPPAMPGRDGMDRMYLTARPQG